MNELTAQDVLKLLMDHAQRCRENGESDMRNILNVGRMIKAKLAEGKSREEIFAYLADDEEEDA